MFWQVSDFLSRKFISDPAEHLVLSRKMKSLKYTLSCPKHSKICEYGLQITCFVIWGLMIRARISAEQINFLDKSQIVCQEKLSEIPQSISCIHKHIKFGKHTISYWNVIKIGHKTWFYRFLWNFNFLVRVEISGEQKNFWTNLRLFVKENYLRSRREQDSDTKHEKSKITILCI